VDDGDADSDAAAVAVGAAVPVAEAAALAGTAAAVLAEAVLAEAVLAEAVLAEEASAAFLADTADMLEMSSEAARATPTISVRTGVGIFMPGGTQRAARAVQRFSEIFRNGGIQRAIAESSDKAWRNAICTAQCVKLSRPAAGGRYGRIRGAIGGL
jgi:hypothetical protein